MGDAKISQVYFATVFENYYISKDEFFIIPHVFFAVALRTINLEIQILISEDGSMLLENFGKYSDGQ